MKYSTQKVLSADVEQHIKSDEFIDIKYLEEKLKSHPSQEKPWTEWVKQACPDASLSSHNGVQVTHSQSSALKRKAVIQHTQTMKPGGSHSKASFEYVEIDAPLGSPSLGIGRQAHV